MSDLEDMGFIIQPHAYSGRIPSDKGYRLYVDSLMHSHELTDAEASFLKSIVINNINQIDYLIKETAKAVALLTKYTTIITEPKPVQTKVKHLQLVPLDDSYVLLVIITNSKAVRNQALRVQTAPVADELSRLSNCLNHRLANVDADRIDHKLLATLKEELGEYGYMAQCIVESILSVISYEENRQVYTSGVKNILAFPEFSDLDKARAIFHTLEEKDMLITLLDNDGGESVQIVIGAENNIENMQGCSIIKTNYNIGGQTRGSIGIIGPTRMDYPQVVAVLNSIVKNINGVISNFL
jgi:heat-inducible transcriptional repressor